MNCLKCGKDIGDALGLCAPCREARDASHSDLQAAMMKPQRGDSPPSFEFLLPVLKYCGIAIVAFIFIFQLTKNPPDLGNIRGALAGPAVVELASKCRSACPEKQWKMCDWMHVVCSRPNNVQGASRSLLYSDQCKGLMDQVTMATTMMKGYCPIPDDAGDTAVDLLTVARANVNLPNKIDAQTTLVRFNSPDGRTLESIYVVDISKEKATAEFKDAIKVANTNQACRDEKSRAGLRYGFARLYTYLFSDGATILTQFKVEESDC